MARNSQSRRIRDAKRRRESGNFVALPNVILRSKEFASLSPRALKLLFDLLAQYNLRNNGDLSIAWTLMAPRGWRSKATLHKAKQELLDEGFLMLTRQGGRNQCSLYAVTFFSIDECGGKLDTSATNSPPGGWRKYSEKAVTNSVPPHHRIGTDSGPQSG